MRFSRSAPALLIATSALAIGAVSYLSVKMSAKLADASEEDQFKLMRSIVEFNLKGAEGRAVARAEMIADLPSVKAIFAARDRPKLLAELKPMFETQSDRYGAEQAQFAIPNSISFLRLNNPDKFGDDLSTFRPIVVDVHRNKELRKGITTSRSGPGVFGVVPIKDDKGEFLGSFEIGMGFGPILDGLKAAYGLESAIYIEEKILKEVATGVGPDIVNDQNRVGRYTRFHSTQKDLLHELVTEEDINVTEESRYVRDGIGVPYGVTLLPLFNYSSKQIGVIAVSKDFSTTRSAKGQMIVWQALAGLIALVLIAVAVIVVIRGSVLTPMVELTKRLKSGTELAMDECCTEIRELAEACAARTPTESANVMKVSA